MELMDREQKDRKVKIKKEIEELLHKPIITSKFDLDKIGEQEIQKIRPIIRKCDGKETRKIRDKSKDKVIRDNSRLFGTKKKKDRKRSIMVE